MSDVIASEPGGEDVLDAGDEQLIRQLADRARSEGLHMTGEGGLLLVDTLRSSVNYIDVDSWRSYALVGTVILSV